MRRVDGVLIFYAICETNFRLKGCVIPASRQPLGQPTRGSRNLRYQSLLFWGRPSGEDEDARGKEDGGKVGKAWEESGSLNERGPYSF